jgi:hypothetical protein
MLKEQELSLNIAQSVKATAKAYDAVRLSLQGDRVHQLALIDELLDAVKKEITLRNMER